MAPITNKVMSTTSGLNTYVCEQFQEEMKRDAFRWIYTESGLGIRDVNDEGCQLVEYL